MPSPLRWLARGAGRHTPLPPEGEGGRNVHYPDFALIPSSIPSSGQVSTS